MLIATGDALPAECAYHDRVWGIGMDMNDQAAADPDKWNGQKFLGFILKTVRSKNLKKSKNLKIMLDKGVFAYYNRQAFKKTPLRSLSWC